MCSEYVSLNLSLLDQPLVVSGPGAGADVTAMGVLGDIIRIAMERA